MARSFFLQNNFTAGQISPLMAMRTDFVRHKNGVSALENLVIKPQGAAVSRTGFLHKAAVKDSSKDTHVIPFQVSEDVSYIIEAGENYFRFYKDDAQIRETAQDITGVTQANPAVVTYSGADNYTNGDPIFIEGIEGMTQLNGREFTVANVDTGANTFELSGVDSTGYDAYTSGGEVSVIYEVAHTYTEAEIPELRYTQSIDVLFINHRDHPPAELARTSDTNWTLSETEHVDGPYLPEVGEGITLTLSGGVSGTVTATASSGIFASTDTTGSGGTGIVDRLIRIQARAPRQSITAITQDNFARVTYTGPDPKEGDSVYLSDIGGMTELNNKTFEVDSVNTTTGAIRLKDTDSTGFTAYTSGGVMQVLREKWVWAKIVSYTSTTEVEIEIQNDESVGSTGPLDLFRLGAWSSTTGFPKLTTFHENRLLSASTTYNKDKVWASAIDGFNDHAPGVDDDNAWDITLLSNTLDEIQWMISQGQLRIGTVGSEYAITGGSGEDSITPTSVNVKKSTASGSIFANALPIQNATLFVNKSGRSIREFTYSFDVDSFVAPDLTIAAEDITRPGLAQVVYQQDPDGVVWGRRTDGALIGMTYLRSQDIVGWHPHFLGGTDAQVKSLAVIPDTNQDQLWAVIERTVNGATAKTIERLGDEFVAKTVNEAMFLDAVVTHTPEAPAATLTPAAVTGTVTFTAGSSVFAATDVGREIRSGSAKAIITAYTSGTEVTAQIVVDFASTSAIASGDWTLSTNTVESLNHLERETVSILADGGVHPTAVVTDGKITLDGQYTTIHIGLGYTQRLVTNKIELPSKLGTAQGSISRVTTLIMRFFESVGAKYRSNRGALTTLDFRQPSDPQDEGVPLFTGDKRVKPSGGHDDGLELEIVQDQPLPMTLLGYVAKGEVTDAS